MTKKEILENSRSPIPALISWRQTAGLPTAAPLAAIRVDDTTAYNAFPSMLIDNRGRLQVYYLNKTTHVASDGVLKRAVSGNGGASWVINTVTTPQTWCHEAHVLLMANGNIGLLVCTNTTSTWKAHYLISADDGETWSTAILVKDTYSSTVGPLISGLFEDRGILYASLYAFVGVSDTRASSLVSKSYDGGKTWTTPITIATNPGSVAYSENRIVRYKDKLVAFVRDDTATKLWRTESSDLGVTWGSLSDVTPSAFAAGQPDPIVVGDMLHYMYRYVNGMKRAVSYDGGATWDTNEIVEVSPNDYYEGSKTLFRDGLLIVAYAIDTATDEAQVKILTYRWGASAGLDGQPIFMTGTASVDHTISTNFSCYVFTGTTLNSTLPPVAGNKHRLIILKNRGSGTATILASGGASEIYTSSAVTSTTITAGNSLMLINDGTYWVTV